MAAPLLFLGNVGEEGEGDLRGVRHLYQQRALAGRIAAHIVLDGAGADSAVTQALGSRRFQVTVTGPGGHSFTDAGTPNPIAALVSALAVLGRDAAAARAAHHSQPGHDSRRHQRKLHPRERPGLRRFPFHKLRPASAAGGRPASRRRGRCGALERPGKIRVAAAGRGLLAFKIDKIGDRPAAQLPADSPLLETLRAVDRHLGLRTELRLGSTDANIPLSLGVPSLSMGAGGEGGGAHTLAEWYSAKDRETGLKRVLLLALTMIEWAAEQ